MRFLISFLLAAVVLFAVSACSGDLFNKSVNNSTPQPSPTATSADISLTATPTPVSSASPTPKLSTTPSAPKSSDDRIRFDPGKDSASISGAVIRGETKSYILGARGGQTMSVTITSLEDNAVFQIKGPSGKYLSKAGETDDATDWDGVLPSNGDYRIIVGGTRGNASFKLTVAIQ